MTEETTTTERRIIDDGGRIWGWSPQSKGEAVIALEAARDASPGAGWRIDEQERGPWKAMAA